MFILINLKDVFGINVFCYGYNLKVFSKCSLLDVYRCFFENCQREIWIDVFFILLNIGKNLRVFLFLVIGLQIVLILLLFKIYGDSMFLVKVLGFMVSIRYYRFVIQKQIYLFI